MKTDEALREDLGQRISRNKGGKYRAKVKTLLGEFGFSAQQRVRQSSLAEVLETLDGWDIEANFSGTSANDYITLKHREGGIPEAKAPRKAALSNSEPFQVTVNPFTFALHLGDRRDEVQSRIKAEDLFAAVWSFKPVCLLIEASDEFFAFAGGYLSAMMRRRNLMARSDAFSEMLPQGPEIISMDRLKAIVGASPERERFPLQGAVYLVRDDADEFHEDDLMALVREVYVPHTYRAKAKFATTSGRLQQPSEEGRAQDHPDFPKVMEWMAIFAGGRELIPKFGGSTLLDLASFMAEASVVRDGLIEHETLMAREDDFRAGYESTEHMVLKGSLLRHLRMDYPDDEVCIEQAMELLDDEGQQIVGKGSYVRPDLRVPGKLWVEVETMRGLMNRGNNPFLNLENKMRAKLEGMKQDSLTWLIVPHDVALLAPSQICAIARNLSSSTLHVQPGVVDLMSGIPIMLQHEEEPRPEVRLSGATWREPKQPTEDKQLTWNDVAGYQDLKSRLTDDLIRPLTNPERYAKFGLAAPNGLLLYGLPGCGKSLIGRVLAGLGDLTCRRIVPSDLTSMWIGEGVAKTRELFDWALKQPSCLLIIDEIDAIAPQRSEHNMHVDEKRQVNEILAQLDRIADKPVMVVGTTNYICGIDTAIRRSGRFDLKIPVLPPNESDRKEIFEYYLNPALRSGISGLNKINTSKLASLTTLFSPADIKVVVETATRRAIARTDGDSRVALSTDAILKVMEGHQRSIPKGMALEWLKEARLELGDSEEGLLWLEREIAQAYPGK
jgi:AAA+ superfamily predicted ATPase